MMLNQGVTLMPHLIAILLTTLVCYLTLMIPAAPQLFFYCGGGAAAHCCDCIFFVAIIIIIIIAVSLCTQIEIHRTEFCFLSHRVCV